MTAFLNTEGGYRGDLTPIEAWEILKDDNNSYLVDVRTAAEWAFVGYPDLSSLSKEVIKLSWRFYPTMQVNDNFHEQIENIGITNHDDKILFICRTGGRSKEAAMFLTGKGYKNCYNVLEGFEGDMDLEGHRGKKNGWKSCNLPWEQI